MKLTSLYLSVSKFWPACLLLAVVLPVRGQLVLGNFDQAHPFTIMPMGDSITDDCVANGAWRLYLQPLLEADGYPFTFVGRISSAPVGSFTKVHHEGYCGSVVAPPGVLTYSVHGYPGPSVYLQGIAADALSDTTPDLVLVMMGANDIGLGRDPYVVATNDMPKLLDIIFSNAPNANVILDKATSLQNATLLTYSNYAANIYLYNAALQAVVNQRRMMGQKVSLADMFSVVNPATMFNSDHLHPNAIGLNFIAREWLARIQAITVRPDKVTTLLIHGGAEWKYSDEGLNLGTNWAQPGYDDSSWSNGIARLGYGDPTVATTVSFGPDPNNKYVTTYFRHIFVVPSGAAITNLNFRLARADGAVVWLNGREVFRSNLPVGPVTYTNLASSLVTGDPAYTFYPTSLALSSSLTDTNLIAVEIHQSSVTNSALGLDMELFGTGYNLPAPKLSIGMAGNDLQLSWQTNAAGYSLYSRTDLTGSGGWTIVTAAVQTNGDQNVVTLTTSNTTTFFRLQNP